MTGKLLVRPLLAYRHAGYPLTAALDPTRWYEATLRGDGVVFVQPPEGPELLLAPGEYVKN